MRWLKPILVYSFGPSWTIAHLYLVRFTRWIVLSYLCHAFDNLTMSEILTRCALLHHFTHYVPPQWHHTRELGERWERVGKYCYKHKEGEKDQQLEMQLRGSILVILSTLLNLTIGIFVNQNNKIHGEVPRFCFVFITIIVVYLKRSVCHSSV